MAAWFGGVMQALAQRRRQWRRARNLRAGAQPRRPEWTGPMRWIAAAGVLAGLGGAAVIAGHARSLQDTGDALDEPAYAASIDALQPAVPGAVFTVPKAPGATTRELGEGKLVVVAGMRAAPAVRINLCTQLQADGSLATLRIGYQFDDVAKLVSQQIAPKNVALASEDAGMPLLHINGKPSRDFQEENSERLRVTVASKKAEAAWQSDAGKGFLRKDGWLLWPDGALRVERRASSRCQRAGELVVQLYRKDADAGERALVTAFPGQGPAVSAWLRPGRYTVPDTPRASLEDQALFQQLAAHQLIRLNASGLVDVAPRDLPAWQAAPDEARAGALAHWPALAADPARLALFKRMYAMADGQYVREQVRIFNHERRLLAWRVRPSAASGAWQASVNGAPVATVPDVPSSAARLFAALPQGWAPWSRIAAWPDADGPATARITLDVPPSLPAGGEIELLLIGRAGALHGARMVDAPRAACTGRACATADAVQLVTLAPLPGARRVGIDVKPLDMGALAGDQQYRHLRVTGGRLAWHALPADSATARRAPPAGVLLHDRHGTLLWSGGAPSREALDAGLAPLLGLRADHASSVAGMLARIPSPSGQPHSARMSIDLVLQRASQRALECIGMRRGQWDGTQCSGGQAAPPGRQAGIVIIDTASGDVLAAAGAGTGKLDGANWTEVRDFDRANPDRSPLRLPAYQHDGGAHRSPGSTFKVISALGLELAAQRDPQLDALLAGMPLAAINRMAQREGFAFQTNAASYPVGTQLAHITNYKDQHLDRRASEGRLGLAQALTYSLNTWFAWSGELSDASLFGRAEGGTPDLQPLDAGALDSVRPIAAMAHRVGFERPLRLDGGLLPPDFAWSAWDALQASQARIDPIHTRHELRQMAIGLRMQATPLHMAMVAGAVGEGRALAPRLLLELDGEHARNASGPALGVRLDRIRAGMKGVVDGGTAAGAFRAPHMAPVRRGLAGKTGTSPALVKGPDGSTRELATVWFTGWLEPGSLPGQRGRLAVAAFVSHSEATGGEHAAPIVAAALGSMLSPKHEQRGK